jgi:hypothetical protein
MIVYVTRNSGAISGVYANPQDFATEAIDDGSAEVQAFYAVLATPPPAKTSLAQAVSQALSDINTYLAIADTATPAQVRTAV